MRIFGCVANSLNNVLREETDCIHAQSFIIGNFVLLANTWILEDRTYKPIGLCAIRTLITDRISHEFFCV